jgi:hypothetical protein
LFKFVGWCIVIGTLHYGYVKTNNLWFGAPEAGLSGILCFLVYAYFMRFTIILPNSKTVVFNAGRPNPFHWPSFIAMGLVMVGTRMLIYNWVEAVVALQAK